MTILEHANAGCHRCIFVLGASGQGSAADEPAEFAHDPVNLEGFDEFEREVVASGAHV